MEYHSDRFRDNSLLVISNKKVMGLLPANRNGDSLISHEGLTYGGIIMTKDNKATDIIEMMGCIKNYCKNMGIKRLIYKAIPSIYQSIPSEEDRYAIYKFGGKLVKCDLSSTISNKYKVNLNKGKKSNVNKALRSGVIVHHSEEYDEMIEMVNRNLEDKYQKKAVHTKKEIIYLKNLFREEIKLITASHSGKMVAGVIVFETKTVAHMQYIASNSAGKEVRAMDILMEKIINKYYKHKDYIDFGISTENNMILNEGLIKQKESFGGRGICYETYMLDI